MGIIERYCRTEFDSYEDFYRNFTINVPENFNFSYDIIDEWAKLEPDKKALEWCNDHGEERTFTFTEISRLSKKAASGFQKLGFSKGDTVMLIVKRRWEFWVLVPAFVRLGVIVIPASFQLTPKDVAYRAEIGEVKMIIAVDDDTVCANVEEGLEKFGKPCMKGIVGGRREGYIDVNALIEEGDEDFVRPTGDQATKNEDIMLGYFTSGTSGPPSLAVHDYAYPLGHILTAKFWQDLQEDDLHITFSDTGWAKCSWGKLWGQWICGAALLVYDYGTRFHPTDLLQVVQDHHVTSFCAPPSVYRFLIREDLSQYHMDSLRKCHTAGEALNPEVFKRWKEFCGLEIREGFGQTETPVIIATTRWTRPNSGSTGMMLPWLNARLIDENDQEVETGTEGEICIPIDVRRPAGLVREYKGNPKKNAESFRNGYYHTGDMAWKDEQGYVWFVGRNDDVIKSSGYRIGPFEVESALMEHPAVLETAVTAVPDPVRGNIVKATIVLTKGYLPSDKLVKELQDHVKKVTAPYKYPRMVEFVDELPKTTSGKIRRVEIRKRDAEK